MAPGSADTAVQAALAATTTAPSTVVAFLAACNSFCCVPPAAGHHSLAGAFLGRAQSDYVPSRARIKRPVLIIATDPLFYVRKCIYVSRTHTAVAVSAGGGGAASLRLGLVTVPQRPPRTERSATPIFSWQLTFGFEGSHGMEWIIGLDKAAIFCTSQSSHIMSMSVVLYPDFPLDLIGFFR